MCCLGAGVATDSVQQVYALALRVAYNILVMWLIYIGPGEGVNRDRVEAPTLHQVPLKAEQNIRAI